jgi:hypothetical protein
MSAHADPNIEIEVERLHQELRALAKVLGIDPDAPNAFVQFAAALLLTVLQLAQQLPRSPTKTRRPPTWRAGRYEQLQQDVDETKARLNCSVRDAIHNLCKDKSRQWRNCKWQTLEQSYYEARSWRRDKIARLLVQRNSSAEL